jgi:hypothetical protein
MSELFATFRPAHGGTDASLAFKIGSDTRFTGLILRGGGLAQQLCDSRLTHRMIRGGGQALGEFGQTQLGGAADAGCGCGPADGVFFHLAGELHTQCSGVFEYLEGIGNCVDGGSGSGTGPDEVVDGASDGVGGRLAWLCHAGSIGGGEIPGVV